jgi:hypothetical protein
MPKWVRGEAEIEQLLARGELERVIGAAADGTPLLEQARKTAATAAGLVSSDAYSAYVLAYDAARFAIRPTWIKDAGSGPTMRTSTSSQVSRGRSVLIPPGAPCCAPAACVARKRLPVESQPFGNRSSNVT